MTATVNELTDLHDRLRALGPDADELMEMVIHTITFAPEVAYTAIEHVESERLTREPWTD